MKTAGARLRKVETAERKSMMKHKTKKLTALLLSAALVALSVPVSAAGSEITPPPVSGK